MLLASRGFHVFGVVRSSQSADELEGAARSGGLQIDAVQADVTSSTAVTNSLRDVVSSVPTVDVLVNSAGVASASVLEDTTPERYSELFDVNLLGTVRCIQAVLPTMRKQNSGTIVNISSVAGRVAVVAQSAYVASKWALEGVSEGLAHELAPFNIRVAIVEPGVTRTPIFGKSEGLPPRGGPYDAHYRRMLRFYKAGARNATEPELVAQAVHHAVVTDRPMLRYTCGWAAPELVQGRAEMSDEEWVRLGALRDDEYERRFEEHFTLAPS